MIKFFRRIRRQLLSESKFSKYLLYAIGEIVLVVIGILIALSINNWNQKRRDVAEEIVILTNLKEDLKADLKGYNKTIDWLKSRQANVDSVLHYLGNPSVFVSDAKLAYWLITSGYILDYTPVYPTYTEIIGSGKLSLIESEEIKRELANYKSNFDNDVRVFTSYDKGDKKIESKALAYTSGKPDAQFYGDDYELKNKNVTIDRDRLLKDEEILALLKLNAYHTQVEINMKTIEYIPMAEALIEIIEEELSELRKI